ncbi:MAG: hypothetical protein AAGA93_17665 [Actinomycetota bacterium]
MTQDQWADVKSKVEGLGLKLKLHIQQEADEDDEREPGSTRAAMEDLGERLEDAFEAFGNAARDPAVRADVKEIGLLLRDALNDTMSQAGDRMRAAADAAGRTDGGSAEPSEPSPFKDSPDDQTQDTVDEG